MLDLRALENALSVIGNVGKGDFTFDVDGVPVTMRVLNADEEMSVQRYAREGIGDGDGGDSMDLLERFKRFSLAHSIVQVGPVDLRGVDFVATGEVLESGVAVRIPRVVAVRKIIDGWTRTATLALFQKYLEMVRRADAAAEKSVKFDVQDLDVEIARVQKRLDDLKQEREQVSTVRRGGAGPAQAVVNEDEAVQARLRTVVETAAGAQPTPPVASTAPVIPEEVPTPPVPPVQSPVPPVQAPAVQAPRQRVMPPPMAAPPARPMAVPVPAAASPIDGSFEGMQDSMGDGPEAIAAETARLVAARAAARKASMASVADDGGHADFIDAPRRTVPPHRGALNTAEAVLDDGGGGNIRATRVSGPVEGVETYRLPPTPVIDRSRMQPPGGKGKVVLDEVPKSGGSNNPRFRPAGR